MRHLIVIFASLAISACSDIIIRTDYQPGTDFNALKTYAWAPDNRQKTGNPVLDSSLLNNRIRNALEQNLSAIGFRHVKPEQADVYLTYYLTLESRIESFPTTISYYGHGGHHRGSSYGFAYGYGSEIQEFKYNTLYIDLISPVSKQIIWRGFAESLLEDSLTPEQRELRINTIVSKIMRQYPPGRKPVKQQ